MRMFSEVRNKDVARQNMPNASEEEGTTLQDTAGSIHRLAQWKEVNDERRENNV